MNFEHWRHYARGWLLHFIGREEQAFTEFAAAYRHNPSDVQAARHLAFLAARRKQFAVAEKWFLEALRITPEDADTHFNLGYAREQMGKPRDAVSSFRQAARLKPVLDRAWYGLGLAHAALGEHDDAVLALEEAARLQPMNGEAWYQLGMACHHAGHFARVEQVVRKVVDFDPKMARRLVKDCGRSDLSGLIPELPF